MHKKLINDCTHSVIKDGMNIQFKISNIVTFSGYSKICSYSYINKYR